MAKRPDWKVVCVRCHEESQARWVVPSSDLLEIMAYLLSIPFFLVPGIAVTLYRHTHAHWECKVCGSREIVPVGSRRAAELRRGSDGGDER